MKALLVILCLLLIIPASLSGCAPAAKEQVDIAVTCDQFSAQKDITQNVEVLIGNKIQVTLCSNPTTGFSWAEKAQIGDPQIIEQVSHNTVAPADSKVVGAPGAQAWVFKALQAGTSKIQMEYGRPWQGGEKGVWKFTLNVTVK